MLNVLVEVIKGMAGVVTWLIEGAFNNLPEHPARFRVTCLRGCM